MKKYQTQNAITIPKFSSIFPRMKYDIVVVGAGASGLAAAWFLSKKGYSVVIIEQGKYITKESMISLEEGGELQKYGEFNPNPNIRKNPGDEEIDMDESDIAIANYSGVGGSTILFSGQYPRFHKSDFKSKSEDNAGVDWPIQYSEIKEFYELNESMVGGRVKRK